MSLADVLKGPTHPDARCGKCEACQYVEATKRIVLAASAPAGPGIGDTQRELWNTALQNNPCRYPLLIVTGRNPQPFRVVGRLLQKTPDNPSIVVNTVEYGGIHVQEDTVEAWTPSKCLEGICFEYLRAGLSDLPLTFYPSLLATLVTAALDKGVFTPHGASTLVRRMEDDWIKQKEADAQTNPG